MSTPIPGHSSPSAGFEVPLEMLAACHLRIENQCTTMRKLVAHLQEHGSDQQAQSASAAVLRYFETAAVHHHEDEELDLFPALVEAMAASDAVCIRELTTSLIADHRELERHWHRLRPQLMRVAGGEAQLLQAAEVDSLIALYERHIAREESELLPMAARLLDDTQLDQIGRAMRERRGVLTPDID